MQSSETRTAPETASEGAEQTLPEREAGGQVSGAVRSGTVGDAVATWHSGARLLHGLLRTRLGIGLMAAAIVAAGLALGWQWLAAVGIAPLLLSALPCVAMCALGLCIKGSNGSSCGTKAPQQTTSKPPAAESDGNQS